jgi:hypothetical protein
MRTLAVRFRFSLQPFFDQGQLWANGSTGIATNAPRESFSALDRVREISAMRLPGHGGTRSEHRWSAGDWSLPPETDRSFRLRVSYGLEHHHLVEPRELSEQSYLDCFINRGRDE